MRISTILGAVTIILGLLISSSAHAERGDKTLIIHTVSYHFDDCYRRCTKKYNQENVGLGFKYGLSDITDIQVGSFVNSFDIQSHYIGANFGKRFGRFKPGVLVGALTGYHTITKRINVGRVTPGLLPNINYNYDRFSANVGYIPAGFAGKSDVLTLLLGVQF